MAWQLPSELVLHSILFALSGDAPDWVPFPIGSIGQIDSLDGGPEVIQVGQGSLDEVTNRALLTQNPFVTVDHDDGSPSMVEFNKPGREFIRDVEQKANEILRELTPDLPGLVLKLQQPRTWVSGRLVVWTAIDRPTGHEVAIGTLSEAQQRWASLAVQIAMWIRNAYSFHAAMLIEEPELGLHATAVVHVAEALSAEAQLGLPTFVTSHSASFLNVPGTTLVHVYRDPERAGVASGEALEESLKHGLDQVASKLGLDRAGALQMYRVLLLVEGQHDRTVLRELFADEWDRNRIRLLLMQGSYNTLSVAGCEVLLNFTDAHIVVVLDNAASNRVPETWQEAMAVATAGNTEHARRILGEKERDLGSRLTPEERVALKFANAAVGTKPDHLHLFGLRELDIIEYLDVALLIPDAKDWRQPESEYRHYRSDSSARESFKDWLRKYRNVEITSTKIKRAARILADTPPPEFSELLDLCVRLASGPPR